MGCNAGVSGAVLTIAFLAYPQKPPEATGMFPCVSATDPRFARLMMGCALIGGFEEIGLAQSRGTWRFLTGFNHITSKIIRRQLYTNTMKVIACIKQCFTSHCPIDPIDPHGLQPNVNLNQLTRDRQQSTTASVAW